MWSAEVDAMFRPRRTFAALAQTSEPTNTWMLVRRPLKWFLVIGACVSLTTTGHLLPGHLVFTAIAWSFSPLLQIALLVLMLRLYASPLSWVKATDLFFVGQGPWLFFLSGVGALCLLGGSAWTVVGVLLRSGLLALAFIATFVWAMLLSYRCFGEGFGFDPRRTRSAFLIFYSIYAAVLVGYFWVTGQLPPLLGVGMP